MIKFTSWRFVTGAGAKRKESEEEGKAKWSGK